MEEKQEEKKYNIENLVPLSERSPEEVKKITSAGGKASVQKKRLAKDMRESVKVLLSMQLTKNQQREYLGDSIELLEGYNITMADVINLKMIQEAGQGNSRAWELLRDTAGFKPVDQVQTDVNIMTENDRALLDKLARREGIKAPED